MSTTFSTGVRFNHNMGVLETLSFVGEGVGAALYIVAFLVRQLPLAMLGILLVIGAVVALRAHLGQPTRGWRALSRLRTAWVSRGTLLISGFVGCSVLSVTAAYFGALQPLRSMLAWAALLFSVPVIIYAGMLLRSMRAIRFWGGALVPVCFSAHSAASALTLACALAPWLAVDAGQMQWLQSGAVIALILAAAASAAHVLLVTPSAGTAASVKRLLAGDLRGRFLAGAGALGIAAPLAGLLGLGMLAAGGGSPAMTLVLAVAGLLRLYGDFAYRNSVVVAGAYEPLFPTQPSRPFPDHGGHAPARP